MSKPISGKLSLTLAGLLCICPLYTQAQHHTSLLQEGWKFHQGEAKPVHDLMASYVSN